MHLAVYQWLCVCMNVVWEQTLIARASSSLPRAWPQETKLTSALGLLCTMHGCHAIMAPYSAKMGDDVHVQLGSSLREDLGCQRGQLPMCMHHPITHTLPLRCRGGQWDHKS